MKCLRVIRFCTFFKVLRVLSVLCWFNRMNGFSVRSELGTSSIYLDFRIPAHMAASYVVLHDVLGFTSFIEDSCTIKLLLCEFDVD